MTQSIHYKKGYIVLLAAFMMLTFTALRSQAQCTWGVTAVAETSTCPANGRITASLTGTDTASVINELYSLEPLGPDGLPIPPSTSPVFENIAPGQYRVVVDAICNGEEVSASYEITVPGSYVPLVGTASPLRDALNACNTGQISVTVSGGRTPYTIAITDAPAAYTGPTSFVTSNTSFLIDNLYGGSYTLSIVDACGTAVSTQTVTVGELPPLAANQFTTWEHIAVSGDGACDKFYLYAPQINPTENPYNIPNSLITYSMAFDGGAKSPYKSIRGGGDTVELPAGQTFKDVYGKVITYYIRTPCGEELVVNKAVPQPVWELSYSTNCDANFNATYDLISGLICYPIYISVKNNSTGTIWLDTMPSTDMRTISALPYGNYTFTATAADEAVLYHNTNWAVDAPDISNPYSIKVSLHPSGPLGNDGATSFIIDKTTGGDFVNTEISLISPSNYTYYALVQGGTGASHYIYNSQPPQPGYFYPGTYKFRVEDACGTYDLPIPVEEKDVYRYTWDISNTEQTCEGLAVTPTGTAMYNNVSRPVYFGILSGPEGYDPAVVPEGTALLLPLPGTYQIGISATNGSVGNYSVNVKTITYTPQPLAIDVSNSFGWVCPGQPDNSGSIVAKAINGTAANSTYTFRLAAEGQGATGPYLATNNTGRFSTATSGGDYTLIKNENYDIQVEDDCGARAVQTIKIIDLATAQLASSDKPQYCLGDDIHFKIVNLPSTATSYAWTGPDGFTSDKQNPVLSGVKSTTGGTYHVTISSDICMQPIEDEVTIELAPYTTSCYSAITDTSVNPYAYGLLGNWRPARSYVYYAAREQSDPEQPTDIRHDGAFNDFIAFWKKETSGWSAQPGNPDWVWNTESTLFSPKGFELENKDPLGRYNAGLYGYDNALPIAVVQNGRYRESAFDGFEDYYFEPVTCDTCSQGGRSFDFSLYMNNLDTTQQHTGKYSLRLEPGATAGVSATVVAADNVPFGLLISTAPNSCPEGGEILKSVRTSEDALLPAFSPLSGKQLLVSAWVKEEQDCHCMSYSNSQLSIVVAQSSGNTVVIAKPAGNIIEGWQRIEQVVTIPEGATGISISLQSTGDSRVYFDDVRVHPYNANMKSFVYNPVNLRLMAELDENNYATFYEYDDDGTLIRLKKETERGIKTIRETRSALLKEAQ